MRHSAGDSNRRHSFASIDCLECNSRCYLLLLFSGMTLCLGSQCKLGNDLALEILLLKLSKIIYLLVSLLEVIIRYRHERCFTSLRLQNILGFLKLSIVL